MKETVQIKALLVDGKHDALISFIDRYNKLFVNKLLLRLCEGILPTYTPTLALFDDQISAGSPERRKIHNIKIHRASSPQMFAFYESLPFGSRMPVMVNLMNHYVQLAEANSKLMEDLYWDVKAVKPLPAGTQTDSTPQANQAHTAVKQDDLPAHQVGASDKAIEVMATPITSQASSAIDNDRSPIVDPLSGFDTGL